VYIPCSASSITICLTGPIAVIVSSVAGSSGCDAASQTEPSRSLIAVCAVGLVSLHRKSRRRRKTHAATAERHESHPRERHGEDGGVLIELADLSRRTSSQFARDGDGKAV
jgi:hypothetical protein